MPSLRACWALIGDGFEKFVGLFAGVFHEEEEYFGGGAGVRGQGMTAVVVLDQEGKEKGPVGAKC